MENENDILNPETAIPVDETETAVPENETEAAAPVEVQTDVPADETETAVLENETEAAAPVEVQTDVPADETAWTVLCELIGEEKAAKFCRAFVRGRKVRITQRKFFVFADVIGAVAAKKIIDTFDGELTTLPEFPLTDKNKEIRNSAIRELRGKIPITTLAAASGLSRRQIIRIQKGEKNERERI